MAQRRDWRGASHGIRQPHVEWYLRRFASTPKEEKECDEKRRGAAHRELRACAHRDPGVIEGPQRPPEDEHRHQPFGFVSLEIEGLLEFFEGEVGQFAQPSVSEKEFAGDGDPAVDIVVGFTHGVGEEFGRHRRLEAFAS